MTEQQREYTAKAKRKLESETARRNTIRTIWWGSPIEPWYQERMKKWQTK